MENNLKYKSLEYWNERYKDEESFEWFGEYARFKQVLEQRLAKTDRILVLGCGNSKMSEEMYLDGYRKIVNTDYSQVIIDLMKQRCRELDEMSWEVKDINELDYAEGSFDCVLEKGTLDALLVGEKNPWNLSDENTVRMDKILSKISKILKPNGKFISITFAQPHFRIPMYAREDYEWSIQQHTIGETFHYFVYVMTKGEALDQNHNHFYCRKGLDSNVQPTTLNDESTEDFLLQISS